MQKFWSEKINQLKEQNLYRKPKRNKPGLISFCSSDYLGLSQNNEVKEAVTQGIKEHGFGSKSSRYINEEHDLHTKLEKSLSNLKKTDDAIIFGSGYLAGTSTLPALVGKGDLIIADKLIHSCLIDGAKLSSAKLLRFDHNDISKAKEILQKNRNSYQKCLIITETVFSMDGDLGKVYDLLELALQYEGLVISDDAHGIGIIKNNYEDKYQDIHLQMGTLSKGVGGYGGYVCGSSIAIDYLRNFAKSSIYSTALPACVLAGNLESVRIIQKDKQLGKAALKNSNYFCELLNLPKSPSCIVVMIIGDAKRTIQAAKEICNNGFLVSAIRNPTVPKGKSRLRITFNANHKKSDIKKLADLIRGMPVF
jgi:8-amino-7-oxononanoate synthase